MHNLQLFQVFVYSEYALAADVFNYLFGLGECGQTSGQCGGQGPGADALMIAHEPVSILTKNLSCPALIIVYLIRYNIHNASLADRHIPVHIYCL